MDIEDPVTPSRHRHPLLWVPTSYFAMGTVYVTVTLVTTTMYKNLGLSVKEAALYASSLALPYTIKPLWAPLLEMYATKKFFVVGMQLVCAAAVAAAALALGMDDIIAATMACFWVLGFAGSTQDIANDGVYVTTLSPKDQARYTGFQGMCWNFGPIFANGVLITLSGIFYRNGMGYPAAWRIVLFIIAAIMLLASVHHLKFLPPGARAENTPRNPREIVATFWDSLVTFFRKPGVWMMIAFSFLYRTSQGFLDKIGPLFMIDERSSGGLGLQNDVFGFINGTVGTAGFILGALLGGLYVSRKGLKPVLFLLCIAINVPNATYLVLGYLRPDDIVLVGSLVTLEKFWFGFGSVGHMLYMMQQLAPGPYQTAHYAFGTALMGLCMMLAGMASGFVYEAAGGYVPFFYFVMVATIPSFVVTWLAPFHVGDRL